MHALGSFNQKLHILLGLKFESSKRDLKVQGSTPEKLRKVEHDRGALEQEMFANDRVRCSYCSRWVHFVRL